MHKSPSQDDKKALVAIVVGMSTSTTGAQSTKHWADDALWFDVPPFASRGAERARRQFDSEFGKVAAFVVEIVETETFINGDMAVVCSVQRWGITLKDGAVRSPMFIRATDCFERRDGRWQIVHEHLSAPMGQGWDGNIVT